MKCSHGVPYEAPCHDCMQAALVQNEALFKQDDPEKKLRDLERRLVKVEAEVAKLKRGEIP